MTTSTHKARIAFDVSSLLWPAFYAKKDKEHGVDIVHEGRTFHVPGADHIYELAVNSLVAYHKRYNLAPRDAILVVEGANSKAPRLGILPTYKVGSSRPELAYTNWRAARDRLVETWRNMGAIMVKQDNAEADDVCAYLARHTRTNLIIASRDNDLLVLGGVNKHGATVTIAQENSLENDNPYGAFPLEFITLYKALVGDDSDKIKGISGFGVAAWRDLDALVGDAGLRELSRLIDTNNMKELALDATKNKLIMSIYTNQDVVTQCWKAAKLHPEWVNTVERPLQWFPGFPNAASDVRKDERLYRWGAANMLVTADTYDKAVEFLQQHLESTPCVGVDFETSSPDESDDWLRARDAEQKVDVVGSTVTGVSINFGNNGQYCYYISIDHADTANVTVEQAARMLAMIPKDRLHIAHNAQGFELPIGQIAFGEYWADNGWRGFFPNMVDTRIGASFWDENRFTFGLKQLSLDLFGYTQVSYEEVTQGKKMCELPAQHVLDYGCDDSLTAYGMWNFFELFMELEGTLPSFFSTEQKPMYLQAHGFLRGVPLDMRRLAELSAADRASYEHHSITLNAYLISRGWDGCNPPVVTPDNIHNANTMKEVFKIVTGKELETRVRMLDKVIACMVEQGAPRGLTDSLLAYSGQDADADSNAIMALNELIRHHFKAAPTFNIGSSKQKQELLYDVIKLPIRLRNAPTPVMRRNGIRQGSPRTDDDAIKMAIKMGDVPVEAVAALKAMMELSSINTRTSLYWEPYPKMLHWKTGKLHPSLKQSSTNTRRYSGSDPNVQQQESSYGGVRSVMLPHNRNAIIVSLDEQAQEVRQLADYCLDPSLLECFIGDNLKDVHSIVGSRIAGVSYDDFRARYKLEEKESSLAVSEKTVEVLFSLIRQRAKITLFATIYGAAAPKIAEGLGITVEEAQGYIDAIYEMFPGVKKWKEESEQFARLYGYVPIHGGTIRHLASLINSDDTYTASKALRQAGNARIQSAGGNQIKRVMSRIWDSNLLDDYDYVFYFSVHDETVHSVSVEHAAEVIPVLHGFMVEQFLNTVPSRSSIGLGLNYGQLREIGEDPDIALINKTAQELVGA